MSKKVLVSHQLPGERIHDLAQHCDLNVWVGPGLLPASSLREELAGCHGLVCLLTDKINAALLADLIGLDYTAAQIGAAMGVKPDYVSILANSMGLGDAWRAAQAARAEAKRRARRSRLEGLVRKGLTAPEIAAVLGVGKDYVYAQVKDAGLTKVWQAARGLPS